MKISPTTADESRGAVLLIGMVAGYVFCIASLFLTYAVTQKTSSLITCFLAFWPTVL